MSTENASRRVVVTGVGAISSLATNANESWERIVAGETGIRRSDLLDPDKHNCLLHGTVDSDQVQNRFLERKALRNASKYSRWAVEAAGEAMQQAGLLDDDLQVSMDLTAGGAALGTCIGGTYDDLLPTFETSLKRDSYSRVPPHLHVMFPHNLAAYTIQHRFGLGGPSSTVVTACATGTQAVGDGYRAIADGHAPMMIAGAAESTHHPLFVAGFEAMRALVTDSNDAPEDASRPFDSTRAGFVLGEGAAMFVLEDLEHAQARGATILAEISGYATSNDAYHPIAPEPHGHGAARAIRAALDDANMRPDEIDHVNAHAASTPAGDKAEANAIHEVFGDRSGDIPVTSIKGAIGHCMAAAGALEFMSAVRTLTDNRIPPTRNHRNPDSEIGLNVVSEPQNVRVNAISKHSFGLGGQNAVVILRRWNGA